MSLTTTSERDLVDLAKKVGRLQRGKGNKPGNAHTWFLSMEAVLRARSLYYLVKPDDQREVQKLKLLKTAAGDDAKKLAQIEYNRMTDEDRVIAILQATIDPSLLNSILGKTAAEAWTILKPVHLANVTLNVWQKMQGFRVKDYEVVVDYIVDMRDHMLILHDQASGEKVFPQAMIVLTTLGQIQTVTLWREWVADTYSENQTNIIDGSFDMNKLEAEAHKRESVLGINSKQYTRHDNKQAFMTHTDDYKKDKECYNCGKKGHFKHECKKPKKQTATANSTDDGKAKEQHNTDQETEKAKKDKKREKVRRKAALAYLVHDLDSDAEESSSEPVSGHEWWEVGAEEYTHQQQDTGDMESFLQGSDVYNHGDLDGSPSPALEDEYVLADDFFHG